MRDHAARAWAAATTGVATAARAPRATLRYVRDTDAILVGAHTRTASAACFDTGSWGSS